VEIEAEEERQCGGESSVRQVYLWSCGGSRKGPPRALPAAAEDS